MQAKLLGKIALLFFIIFISARSAFAQQVEGAKAVNHFSSAVSVTTKGISTVPTFTLGKPAAIFDLSMGRRLRFEPQFRFALEGKPWTFLFWWRYKLLAGEKFSFTLGTHPALAFRTVPLATSGAAKDGLIAQRYLAGELTPTYSLTKNFGVGMYYLYSYGVEKGVTKHTHYLALRNYFQTSTSPSKWSWDLRRSFIT